MKNRLLSQLILICSVAAIVLLIFSGYRSPKYKLMSSSTGTIDQSLVSLIVNAPIGTAQLDSEGNGNSLQPVVTEPNIGPNYPVNPPLMIYGNEGILIKSPVPGFWKVWFDQSTKSVYSASIINYSSSSLASQVYGQLQSQFQGNLSQLLEPAVLQSTQPYSVLSIQTNYGFEVTANLNQSGMIIPLIMYADLYYSNNVECLT